MVLDRKNHKKFHLCRKSFLLLVNSKDPKINFRDNDGANAVHSGNYQVKFYQFLINLFKIIASEAGNEEMVELLIEKNVA